MTNENNRAADEARIRGRKWPLACTGYDDNRSVWQKHRDKITTAGGAVGGAVLGGLSGGKKGGVIGAIAGGGGAAVYTYKVRKKDRNY